MNFDLTDDQKMLRDTAASFVKKESPVDRLRKTMETELGYDQKVYEQMGELGWLSVPFPDELGGFGGTFVDAALIIEQLGTTLVPEPYVPSVILGGMAILRAGTDEQKRRWITPLCEGQLSLALAYAERDSRFDVAAVGTKAATAGDGYKLTGEKVFVLNGQGADEIVVSARAGDRVALFVVPRDAKGLAIQNIKTMDGRRAAIVRLDGVAVSADRALGDGGDAVAVLEDVMDLGAAAACAEGVGIQQTMLDMTVDYLKTREQFGVRIGTFQALQHRAVDMFVQTQLSRSLSAEASIRVSDLDSERDIRRSAVSAAKVQLATGGKWVSQQAVQLHGGIAITEEHDAGLYFKRMHILNTLYGDEEHHVARYGALPTFGERVGA